jgi:hypothetical protein
VAGASSLVARYCQDAVLEVHVLPASAVLLAMAHSSVERQIKLRHSLRKPFENHRAELLFLLKGQDTGALIVLGLVRNEPGRVVFCLAVAAGQTVSK